MDRRSFLLTSLAGALGPTGAIGAQPAERCTGSVCSLMRLEPRTWLSRRALGYLQLPPHEPELQMLHRWLDSWTGAGFITVGVERQGLRLSLSHITEGGWRATFMGASALLASRGSGAAPTPWRVTGCSVEAVRSL